MPGAAAAPDLTVEAAAAGWIRGEPDAYCRTRDRRVLERILPDSDLETGAFYRWTLDVERTDLEAIIRRKTGWDPGELLELVPLQRGHSGRLVRVAGCSWARSWRSGGPSPRAICTARPSSWIPRAVTAGRHAAYGSGGPAGGTVWACARWAPR